jgi:hypothetical protein
MHDRPWYDELLHPCGEGVAAGVGQDREAQPARAPAADLDDHANEGLLAVPAGDASLAGLPDQGLVDLDLAAEGLALGGDHRQAQLLQDQPSGLIAGDPELALELHGGDPRRVGRHQIGSPEPESQRRTGAVHDGPRGDRGLLVAFGALPEVATLECHNVQPPDVPSFSHWTRAGQTSTPRSPCGN